MVEEFHLHHGNAKLPDGVRDDVVGEGEKCEGAFEEVPLIFPKCLVVAPVIRPVDVVRRPDAGERALVEFPDRRGWRLGSMWQRSAASSHIVRNMV